MHVVYVGVNIALRRTACKLLERKTRVNVVNVVHVEKFSLRIVNVVETGKWQVLGISMKVNSASPCFRGASSFTS